MSATTTRRWSTTVLLALATAVAAVGVAFLVRAHTLRSDGPAANRAVVDRVATGRVLAQVSTALDAVLSYDYAHPERAAAAARTWLTGDAPAQYRQLFRQLQSLAPGQQLTLVAKVVTGAVTTLDSTHAQLLVFLDQQSTRASDRRSSVSAAQVQISAVLSGGRWRIAELHPL